MRLRQLRLKSVTLAVVVTLTALASNISINLWYEVPVEFLTANVPLTSSIKWNLSSASRGLRSEGVILASQETLSLVDHGVDAEEGHVILEEDRGVSLISSVTSKMDPVVSSESTIDSTRNSTQSAVLHNLSELSSTDIMQGSRIIPDQSGPECYADKGIPSFIIAGAQKAGTSALYYVLEEIEELLPSLAFETHFYDARGNLGRNASAFSMEDVCEARRKYFEFFDLSRLKPGMLTFEKTPVYLCRPFVPELVKMVTPWAKIVILLRNPVDRAYSAFKMDWERGRPNFQFQMFEEIMEEQISMLRNVGLSSAPLLSDYIANVSAKDDFAIPPGLPHEHRNRESVLTMMIARGMYAVQLKNWLEYFPLGSALKVVQFEKFEENPSAVVNEILEFVGAEPVDLPRYLFNEKYKPKRFHKKRVAQPLSSSTRSYLEEFYKPYNDELADLLGEEWRDVWN